MASIFDLEVPLPRVQLRVSSRLVNKEPPLATPIEVNGAENLSSLALEETVTSKGKRALVIDGYVYLLNKKTLNERTYWICRYKGCSARLNLDPVGSVTKKSGHSHEPIPEEVKELTFKQMLKEMVRDDTAPVKRIYEETKKRFAADHGSACDLPSFEEVRASLYRVREGGEDPEDCGRCRRSVDMTLRGSELMTILGEPWLFADEEFEYRGRVGAQSVDTHLRLAGGTRRLLMFADNPMLQLLSQSSEWWIEGAFTVRPRYFKKLFIVFCSFENDVFPVVYGFLPSKSRALYVVFFQLLKAKLTRLGCPTKGPTLIHSDFDVHAVSAAAQELPSAQIVGRYYHLVHTDYKHVQTFLGSRYLQNASIRSQIRQLWALAMLPRDEVETAFEEIAVQFPNDDQELTKYINCFRTTWIQDVFPPDCWNISCIKNRVNMDIEMWFRRLNTLLEGSAAKFHRFLWRLRKEQHVARISAAELRTATSRKQKHKRDSDIELRLNLLKGAYESNKLTRSQYLKRCVPILCTSV